jgi:hypothetical protein
MIRRPTKGKKPPPDVRTEAAAGDEGADDQAYNFRFVEVGEPSQGGDDDSRTTIRSHVMRDYYEKKDNRRRPSTLPESSSAASQKGGVLQQTHRFKVGPQGLQEVKAGRKKSKGISRATKKASSVATNFPDFEDSQVHTQSSPGAPHFSQPESAAVALPAHWTRQPERISEDGQLPAADTDIIIGDAHLPPPSESDSRNIAPPEPLSPTSGGIDPFNTLPVLCSPRTQLLLYHGESNSSIS